MINSIRVKHFKIIFVAFLHKLKYIFDRIYNIYIYIYMCVFMNVCKQVRLWCSYSWNMLIAFFL